THDDFSSHGTHGDGVMATCRCAPWGSRTGRGQGQPPAVTVVTSTTSEFTNIGYVALRTLFASGGSFCFMPTVTGHTRTVWSAANGSSNGMPRRSTKYPCVPSTSVSTAALSVSAFGEFVLSMTRTVRPRVLRPGAPKTCVEHSRS